MSFEMQSLSFLLLVCSVILLIFYVFLISRVYYEYLQKGGSWLIALRLLILFIVPISLIPIVYTIYPIFYKIFPIFCTIIVPNPANIFYLFIPLSSILLIGKFLRCKCGSCEEFGKIENIPVFICHEKKERVYNAWYDPRKKKITITKSLYEILSEDERKAVLYHEIGHSKLHKWDSMVRITGLIWFISVSVIIIKMPILIQFSNLSQLDNIVYSFWLFALFMIYFMFSHWVNEHEADVYAVKFAGFKAMSRAMLKTHIYKSLNGFESSISAIEFSDSFEIGKLTYFQVLKTMLRWILSKPHPPLRLRIEKIGRAN